MFLILSGVDGGVFPPHEDKLYFSKQFSRIFNQENLCCNNYHLMLLIAIPSASHCLNLKARTFYFNELSTLMKDNIFHDFPNLLNICLNSLTLFIWSGLSLFSFSSSLALVLLVALLAPSNIRAGRPLIKCLTVLLAACWSCRCARLQVDWAGSKSSIFCSRAICFFSATCKHQNILLRTNRIFLG